MGRDRNFRRVLNPERGEVNEQIAGRGPECLVNSSTASRAGSYHLTVSETTLLSAPSPRVTVFVALSLLGGVYSMVFSNFFIPL